MGALPTSGERIAKPGAQGAPLRCMDRGQVTGHARALSETYPQRPADCAIVK
jgi:hypothetical protein